MPYHIQITEFEIILLDTFVQKHTNVVFRQTWRAETFLMHANKWVQHANNMV